MLRRLGPLTAILACLALPARAADVSGVFDTDQVWTVANSPYRLTGTVQVNATLRIEPGVTVTASSSGGFGIVVAGKILVGIDAQGAQDLTKPVVFRGTGVKGSWAGITINASANGVVIRNTDIAYATVGLTVNAPAVIATDSKIHDCSTHGIYVGSGASLNWSGTLASSVIENNGALGISSDGTLTLLGTTVRRNAQGGIDSRGNAQITANEIALNGASSNYYFGVRLTNALAGGTQTLSRNVVHRNSGGGASLSITASGVTHVVEHNTFDENDLYTGTSYYTYELYASQSTGSLVVRDNLATNNRRYGLYRQGSSGTLDMHHNLAWNNASGNLNGFGSPAGMLYENPLYAKTDGTNYRLTENSPAREADSQTPAQDLGALAYQGDQTPGLMGTLRASRTLGAAGSPYSLDGDLVVPTGVTLTLEPGVRLVPATSDATISGSDTSKVELIVRGTLVVQGTSSNRAVIAPQSATQGAWAGLFIAAGGTATDVEFLELAYARTCLTVEGTAVFTNAKIHDCQLYGAVANKASDAASPGTLTLTGDAGKHGGHFLLESSVYNTSIGNTGYAGIYGQGEGVVTVANTDVHTSGGPLVRFDRQATITGSRLHASTGEFGVRGTLQAGTTLIQRNLIYGNYAGGIHLDTRSTSARATVENNTIDSNRSYGIYLYHYYGSTSTHTIRKNILSSNGTYGIYKYGSAYVAQPTYNDVYGQSYAYYGVTAGSGSLTSNPLYNHPTAGDYRLQPTSPARDADGAGGDLGALAFAEIAVGTVVVSPATASVAATTAQQFTAQGTETWSGYPVNGLSYTWASTGGGTIDANGRFTAGCTTGAYADAVRATAGGATGKASVTVGAGPAASVTISPETKTLGVNQPATFTATTRDSCGNASSEAVDFSIDPGQNAAGTISPAGAYNSGVRAGAFTNAVRATSKVTRVVGYASVTVNPDPLSALVVSPLNASVGAGARGQFTAAGKDRWDNPVAANPTWSLAQGCALGTMDGATGVFTAGSTTGTCTNGVLAQDGNASGTATIGVTNNALSTITVTPASGSVPVNGKLRFAATGRDSAGNVVALAPTWSVSANGGSIDSTGTYTAACATGTYTITATQGSVSGSASVTVTVGAVASVQVSPATASVGLGSTQQFSATGRDACNNAVTITPTWSVVAGGGSVSTSGLFTPASTLGTYANTVRASVGSVHGFASVTVTAGPLATITITPDPATVEINKAVQFIAKGTDAAGNPVSITPVWSVGAGGGTITSAGLFTAGATAGTFTSTVRATSGSVVGRASVVVEPGALASIVISPSSTSVAAGGTKDFDATGRDAGGNTVPVTVTWSVAAGGGSIDTAGRYRAGTTAGSFSNAIRAQSGSIAAFASVTITAGPLASLSVTPASTTLRVGESRQFQTDGRDQYGNPVNTAASWSIVAGGGTITGAGYFTAGNTPGNYANTVRATAGSLTANASVVVEPGALATITITPNPATIEAGATVQFTAKGTDSAGNAVAFRPTWLVASGGGTIDPSGRFTAGNVANTFANTVTAYEGAVSGHATVVVTPGPATRLEVQPSDVSLAIYTDKPFAAKGFDRFNNETPVTATWSVLAGGGTITSAGVFTAGSRPGRYANTVRAVSGSLSATASVTVVPGPATSLTVTPGDVSLAIGATQQFSATGVDAAGNTVTVAPTWTLEAGGGSITGTGLFTAGTRAGAYAGTITARSGSAVGRANVTVNPGNAYALEVTPGPATVRARSTIAFAAIATDFYGNEVAATPTWSVAVPVAGTITPSGLFTSGPTAGRYAGAVVAKFSGLTRATDVTITAGSLLEIVVTPGVVTLKGGDAKRFTAEGRDVDGNVIALAPEWTALNGVGSITGDGELSATMTPGSYGNAVRARAAGVSGFASVTITPAEVARVGITPESPVVPMGRRATFVATGYTARGQVVVGVEPKWAVLAGGGTIDASGVFTAGTTAGTYERTVEATVGSVKATATVLVPGDFDGDGIDDAYEVANRLDVTDRRDALGDSDSDRLNNLGEFQAKTDPQDADSDDDGVRDGDEPGWNEDTDADGKPNASDPDSDGDGVLDGTEMAVVEAGSGTDTSRANFIADADPSTSTDPRTADTDGDTLPDGEEDWNHNGAIDEGETDPNAPEVACQASTECVEGRYCVRNLCLPPRPCVPGCGRGETCNFDGVCEPEVERERRGGCGCGSPEASALGLVALAFAALARRRSRPRPE